MFSKKGLIAVAKENADEEKLMDIVLEHGGEDLSDEGETWEIMTDPGAYEGVLDAVKRGEDRDPVRRDHDDRFHLHQA